MKKLGCCPECGIQVEEISGTRYVKQLPTITDRNVGGLAQPLEYHLFPCDHWLGLEQATALWEDVPQEKEQEAAMETQALGDLARLQGLGLVSSRSILNNAGIEYDQARAELLQEHKKEEEVNAKLHALQVGDPVYINSDGELEAQMVAGLASLIAGQVAQPVSGQATIVPELTDEELATDEIIAHVVGSKNFTTGRNPDVRTTEEAELAHWKQKVKNKEDAALNKLAQPRKRKIRKIK